METTTNRKDFMTWNMTCYECGCKFTAYSWNYNDPPVDYCCSDECYQEYETIHNKRDRRINYLLDEREV